MRKIRLEAVWIALLLAAALVPDEKLLRRKLLAVEGGVAAVLLLAFVRGREWTTTPLDVPVAAYGAAAVGFYALSPQPQASQPELVRAGLSCLSYFAATQVFPASERPERLAAAWSLSASLAAAYAVLQRLGEFGPFLFPQMDRPMGTFGNPIFLGTYLAASLAVTASLVPKRRGWLAATAVQGVALALTQSRAAVAGLLVSVVLWLALKGRRGAASAAAVVLGAAAILYFHGRSWSHLLIWKDTLRLWLSHPWLGCGLGLFPSSFPAFASAETKALWPPDRMIVNFAHNEYLQVLAETGILGLAAFLAAPVAFLARWRPSRSLEDGWAVAGISLFAAAFFSPDLRFGVSAFFAFSALGATSARLWGRQKSAPGWMIPGGIAVIAGWAFLAVRPALAERRLSQEASFNAQATPEISAQIRGLEAKLAASPDADTAELLGYLYARQQAWPAALSRYELAARLAPERPGPFNNLGNIRYLLGDYDAAVASWEKSLALKPDQLDAHLNLGKLYYERGRLKESTAHLEAALRLNPGNAKARVLLQKMVE